jgi:phosphoribosylamine--glycine ligase
MGAYSPAPIIDNEMHQKVIDQVMKPTMEGLIKEGSPYLGFLYAGLMIKDNNIKVLEFNCRFGDPETQPILFRLKSSLVSLCFAAIENKLDDYEIEWDQRHSCGVVIASQGYPEDYVANKIVDIVESQDKDSKIFHAGTELKDNKIITSGGRVFCATALGKDLKEAQSKAYETVKNISFDGAYYRKDIGNKGIK